MTTPAFGKQTVKQNQPAAGTENQKRTRNTLLTIMQELQALDPEFPIQYAICLLEIAQDEGLSLTALADRTAMPLSTVSRIVGALSDNRQRGGPFDLVTVQISATERRRKELTLTAKGRAIIERLCLIIDA